MLVSLIVRQYKTFKNQTFIPLLDNGNLTGILGLNGIGKSSVLEAIDCFFNDKPWNLHISAKKSGTSSPVYIVPIFLVEKSEVPSHLEEIFAKINKVSSDVDRLDKEVNPAHKPLLDGFKAQLDGLARNFDLTNYYLIPLGITHQKEIHSSFFSYGDEKIDSHKQLLADSLEFLREKYQYIYIPKDVTPEQYTQLENNEIQKLMGLTLEGELAKIAPGQLVNDINQKLNALIGDVSLKLKDYEYRTPHNKQQNLKKGDIYKLIIKAFFAIRVLHKRFENGWLPINQLSTGEKAKSLLDLSERLIANHHADLSKNLIIAIDEPEASLHISACFAQFEKIEDLAVACRQVLFATHWYGFLSMTNNGTATVISRSPSVSKKGKDDEIAEDIHKFDLVDLRYHREQVKQASKKSSGMLPFDIRLKSVNDLIQSIASSVSLEVGAYNWIICEGSTERLYLKKYLIDHYGKKNLKIVPVGGAREIKKIYQHLAIIFDDLKASIRGRVILLSDTDEQLVDYSVADNSNLICKRFVANHADKKIYLVDPASNPKSPATCIEDVLNVDVFGRVMEKYYQGDPLLADLPEISKRKTEVCFGLDLRKSEELALKEFFEKPGRKYEFARYYASEVNMQSDGFIPNLFVDLNHLLSKKMKTS